MTAERRMSDKKRWWALGFLIIAFILGWFNAVTPASTLKEYYAVTGVVSFVLSFVLALIGAMQKLL